MECAHAWSAPTYSGRHAAEIDKPRSENIVLNNRNNSSAQKCNVFLKPVLNTCTYLIVMPYVVQRINHGDFHPHALLFCPCFIVSKSVLNNIFGLYSIKHSTMSNDLNKNIGTFYTMVILVDF
jgi:hypothetical protein